MTVPLAAPAPAAEATTAHKLAHLARLKRACLGGAGRKEALLKAGEATGLVALLQTSPASSDESLAVSAEAANVLAALSLPNLAAVSILLSSSAHLAVVRALSLTLSYTSTSPDTPPTAAHKFLESHLRALKSLFSDLVKVVGPREWGTDIVGASIDVEERRDAESLWHPQVKAKEASAKGKEKEEDVPMRGVDAAGGDDLAELKKLAQAALEEAFRTSASPTTAVSTGPSSSASFASSSPSLLYSLVDLLVDCSAPDAPTSSYAPRMRLAELICSFLAGTVRLPQQRMAVAGGDKGKEVLAALRRLAEHGSDKVKESALKALTVLVRDSHDAMLTLLGLGTGETYATRLTPFTSLVLSPLPPVRLAAATLLSVLAKLTYPPPGMHIPEAELGAPVLNVLMALAEKEEGALRAGAAFSLAYLVADEPHLQARAIAGGIFRTFHTIVSQPLLLDQPYPTPSALEEDARIREGILLCIASLSALYEPHRRLVLDVGLLPHLLGALQHPVVGVRAAGCHCVRALSRSVNVLRTDLVEAHAEDSLVRLLAEDENEVVKITASAAVANLLLEFSPMRAALVDAGCIPRMCQLAVKSTNGTLRLNAMWAIKNATYEASADFKRLVLQYLTWDSLYLLITTPDPQVPEQALGILRNIVCATHNESITGLGPGEMGEERMLGLFERVVAAGGERGEGAVVQALYCVSNIATAHEAAQLAIASRTTLLRYLLSYLDSRSLALRLAALWALHNLIFRRGSSSLLPSSHHGGESSSALPLPLRRPHEIVDKLRALGLDGKLRMLERDPELDVRERVRDLREAMA
ncbi:hypothetical protein JCM10213_004938 [Rhodosporidiobolus nylandii]